MLTNETPISQKDFQDIQECLLKILKAIHKVCEEHNIRYYIIAGTMLGAVRHKGFIPWDDDADVAMPREDYNRFLAYANEWLPEPYELVCSAINKRYPYIFARVQDKSTTYILRRSFDFVGGIPVDVFPLDGMTANPIKHFWHYKRYGIMKRFLYFSLTDPLKRGYGLRYLFVSACHKLLPIARVERMLNNLQSEYSYGECELVADHDNNPHRGILPKEVYGEPTLIAFEDTMLNGVANPDYYLKVCYGNYMEMPKKMPPLNFKLIDLEKPYKQYIEEERL